MRILLPCIAFIVGTCMGFLIYRSGYDDGRHSAGQAVPERKPVISIKKPDAPVNKDPYYDDILANIEAYDGTEFGQKEVRHRL